MSENPSRASLLNWLIERFDGRELAPPRSSLEELSDVAERLVRPHLEQRQPLRRAAVAKKLATLSKNLGRAARAATDLGEQGMSHVLLASGELPRVVRAREKRFWERRRPRHLLSGIAKCGCCQGALSAVGRDYLACLNARKRGTCDNRKGIRRARLEELVLSALKHRLMRPDLVKEFVAAFQEEVNRDRRNQESALGVSRRELTGVPVCDAAKSACPALNQCGGLKNPCGNSRKARLASIRLNICGIGPRLGVIGSLKHLYQYSMCH